VLRTSRQYWLHKHGVRRYPYLDFEPAAVRAQLQLAATEAKSAAEVRGAAHPDG